MSNKNFKILNKIFSIFLLIIVFLPVRIFAVGQPDGTVSESKATLFLSPRTGSFFVGSTFDVGVYVNTKNQSINTVNLELYFDPQKLSVVRPTGGQSIFGIWIEAPIYDNKKGVVKMAGVIPEGIITSSGLVAKVSFKVIGEGATQVGITKNTEILLNDGLGTKVDVVLQKSNFTLERPVQEGVYITSVTHPFQDEWYNNNSPSFSWENLEGSMDGYSVVLDTKPYTTPDNTVTTIDNSISYKNIEDGVHYLHVKSLKGSKWSSATHYQVRIDTTPPIHFSSDIKFLDDLKQYMVFFNTIDETSSVGYYEVGVLNNKNTNALPVFVEAISPYALPYDTDKDSKVIIRVFDKAGNITESVSGVNPSILKFVVIGTAILLFALVLLHYIFGHHIGRNIRRAFFYFKHISNKEDIQ